MSSSVVLGGTAQSVPVVTSELGSSFCILQSKVVNHSPSFVPDAVHTGNCHVMQFFEKDIQPWLSDS
jgi:hypothetical protein